MSSSNQKLKIFIPSKNDPNPFLDQIIEQSTLHFKFGSLETFNESFSIVLINWPEALFNWREPTLNNLKELEDKFLKWKKTASIVYVVHDLEKHNSNSENYSKLFNLVIKQSDYFIHLGQFSKDLLSIQFPNKNHVVIPHPLYEKGFDVIDQKTARKKLGIKDNKVIFIAPGRIRTLKERKFIIRAFNSLSIDKKLLVIPNMSFIKTNLEFKGKYWLKPFIDINKIYERFVNINLNSKIKIMYGFRPFRELSLLMSASDIVIVPRLKILNSGNVFLGLTYKKTIVGPELGNVKEYLDKFEFPTFKPDSQKSVENAFQRSLKLYKNYKYDDSLLTDLSAKVVAEKWDDLMVSIYNDKYKNG